MRQLLFLPLLLLLCLQSKAQTVDSLWQGWLSPFVQTGGSAPVFEFQGLFNSNAGFNGTQIDLAQHPRLIVFSNNVCYELPIDSITSTGSVIAGCALDPSGQLSALPGGMAAIYHPSSIHRVGPFTAGLSASLQSCVQTMTNLKIDSLTNAVQTGASIAGDGSTISPLVIAQQGATPGQVLHWNGTDWSPADDAVLSASVEAFPAVNGNTITPSLALPATNRAWRIDLFRTGVRMTYGLDFSIVGSDIILSVGGQDEAFYLIVR